MSNNLSLPGTQPEGPDKKPRTGLLSSYRQQQQNQAQQPSSAEAVPEIPYSPVPQEPTRPASAQGMPSQRLTGSLPPRLPSKPVSNGWVQPSQPLQDAQAPGNVQPPVRPVPQQSQPGWMTNAVNFVRQVSGKMRAIRPAQSDGNGSPEHTQWKRSRAVRHSIQKKRRLRWSQKHPKAARVVGWTALGLMVVLVIGVSIGGVLGFQYYQEQSSRIDGLANKNIQQNTRIYDRNNNLIAEVYDKDSANTGRRIPVSYNDVPKVLVDAQIAIEDASFWENAGIDPTGIMRAFLQNSGGGSTLTQQVIKNLSGDDRISYDRKLTEAVLAISLTQKYPKWKILEMYFNVAGYGAQNLGVESAAQNYFHLQPVCDEKTFKCTPAISRLEYNEQGKKDPLLGLARASLLAGLPQNPVYFDPTVSKKNKERALERQEQVLQRMIETKVTVDGLGVVTPELKEKAHELTKKMTFTPYKAVKKAPHFVDWIQGQMEQILGNGDVQLGHRLFLTGGFNIRTTIDLSLQEFVENAVKRHLYEPDYQPLKNITVTASDYYNLHSAAVVVLNAKTGEILAMNGSPDYYSQDERAGGQYNAAAAGGRQIGSTVKPLIYSTTFMMGWYPAVVLPDFETFFPNGAPAGTPAPKTPDDQSMYHPKDYNDTYNGRAASGGTKDSTIRVATANSFNVPAVKSLAYVGVDNFTKVANQLGLNPRKQDQNLTMALGAFTASPLQMAGAYQALANGGERIPPTGILEVWDNYGHQLYKYDVAKVKKTRVFSPEVSYLMTSVLTDEKARAFEFLNAHTLSFWDWDQECSNQEWYGLPRCAHDVAAKTGTTDEFKDNWTVGYTPNIVTSVWAGNANNEPMANGPTGITGAGPIWHSVMEYASGRPCKEISEGSIKCPSKPFDPKKAGLTQPSVFEKPANVVNSCEFAASDGLNRNGGETNCDYVIKGTEPQTTGVVPPKVLPGKDNKGNNGNNGNNGNGGNNGNNGNNGNQSPTTPPTMPTFPIPSLPAWPPFDKKQ
ncbi:membrane peptidoglycan carboxypeptidase [Thermosporothrix hazakensis]|uniref:Membrane peptidoglycan carboxypeptidase n=1 Tax=Thermosporothrix hazakensis TaxID=644383 RepID=A0A326U6Z7_THEHA|nr:transglycosylase domain-containing protein [Thermosporothrix hazakensis]PZW26377.1 membrane peptidoglycan carboxypeptidase [Thermosporothrix hazakensis]GCE48671.1 hypothetical protein KTH_35400 [Thermosporothrix hazakensis]